MPKLDSVKNAENVFDKWFNEKFDRKSDELIGFKSVYAEGTLWVVIGRVIKPDRLLMAKFNKSDGKISEYYDFWVPPELMAKQEEGKQEE